MLFLKVSAALTSCAAAYALTGGIAMAQGSMAGGAMMRADGTMTMSPSLASVAAQVKSMSSCRAMTARLQRAMPAGGAARCFTVRIENISTRNGFTASNGTRWSVPFSPGVFAVTAEAEPMFRAGTPDRGLGLRALSEDGNPVALFTAISRAYPGSGAFLVPAGGSKPMGIVPGRRFEFIIAAQRGQRLHFVTMHGQSNDWFYGTPAGITLFDANGVPAGGDVTSAVKLYDAGTEADQELGIGSTQGPRQPHPRFGPPDADSTLRLAASDPRFVDATKVMRVTVTPQ